MTKLVGAIFGYGRAGVIHYGNLKNMDDVEIRYIVDPRNDLNTDSFNKTTKHVQTVEEAVCDKELEFVFVCSPTACHNEGIQAALKNGIHIFCEKPLTFCEKEMKSLFSLANDCKKLLFTAFNRRYDPRIRAVKKAIDDKEIGNLLSISIVSRDHPYPPPEFLKISGNIYRDCAVHDLDQLCWMMGDIPQKIKTDACVYDEERAEGMFETCHTILKFSGGRMGYIMNSRIATSYDQRIEALGDKDARFVTNPISDNPLTFAERYAESYVIEAREFLEKVKSGDLSPNLDFDYSLKLENLLSICMEVVNTGKEVDFS